MSTAVYELVKRPTSVLLIMPRSCNLVFDLLASSADKQGSSSLTMAEIGKTAHISRQTVWRALKRLLSAHLLEIREHGTGRGRGNVYFIRAFALGRKKRKPVSNKAFVDQRYFSSQESVTSLQSVTSHHSVDRKGVSRRSALSFPQESVSPRYYKESQKRLKSLKASKDTTAIKSPGHAMFLARSVLKSNASITEDQKETLLQALGFAIFKRGWFDRIKATPGILHDSLHLLAQRRPPGFPARGSPRRWIFSWLLGLLKSMAEKYRLGVAAVVQAIHDRDGSQKCGHEPEAREYGITDLSTLLSQCNGEGPEEPFALRQARRRYRVVRRRSYSERRELAPLWGQ